MNVKRQTNQRNRSSTRANTLSFANTTQEGNQGTAIRTYVTGTGYSAGEHAALHQKLRLPLGSHSQRKQNTAFPSIGNTFLGHGKARKQHRRIGQEAVSPTRAKNILRKLLLLSFNWLMKKSLTMRKKRSDILFIFQLYPSK